MIRSLALTGNPLAPLFNAWFPHAYFLEATERTLAHFMRTYQGFEFRNAPWELALGGASHGILEPLFLALPVGLLALRSSAGRRVWLAAGLLFCRMPRWVRRSATPILSPRVTGISREVKTLQY